MRTKNACQIDDAEAAWLADVKSVGCTACPWDGPTEAHHPKGCQGLHRCTASLCKPCHDAQAWKFCGATEMQLVNETNRRVDEKRRTGHFTRRQIYSLQHSARAPRKRGGTALSSNKIIRRPAA